MKTLVPNSFFDTPRRLMAQAGFCEFSFVQIDLADAKYHVPVAKARNTGIFFWVPQKSMLVQLDYHEHSYPDNPDRISSYWKIQPYLQFQPRSILLEQVESTADVPLFFEGELRELDFEIPGCRFVCNSGGLGEGPNMPATGHFEINQSGSWENQIRFEPVVQQLVFMRDSVNKYLGQLPFTELQVTTFPPFFSLPGCEKIFWERFDRRNLRSLITRPWGSDGLKR